MVAEVDENPIKGDVCINCAKNEVIMSVAVLRFGVGDVWPLVGTGVL
jgi:hypothetical protein